MGTSIKKACHIDTAGSPVVDLIKSITKIEYISEKEKENQYNLRFIAINSIKASENESTTIRSI